MEEAVAEEVKVGELMIDDFRREVDVLHQMSASLLLFDLKRKRLESHFESLVELIQRKQTEAMEAIRVKEEEAKARVDQLRDERLEEQEKRYNSILKVKMEELDAERKRLESQIAEMEREVNEANMDTERMAVELCKKEREMRQSKIDAERMAMELCEKKKEVNEIKKIVEDLTARIREDARLGVTCKLLTGENFALQEKVKSLTKELEKQGKRFNDILKVKMKEVAEERERIERQAAEKELEKQEKRFDDILKVNMKELTQERERIERRATEKEKGMRDAKIEKERMVVELCEKEKEVNEMKKTVAGLTAKMQEDARLKVTCKQLSGKNLALREEVKSLEKELKKHEKQFNDIIKEKMKEVAVERERVERQAAEKEKQMLDAKTEKERLVVEFCEKEKEVNEMKKTVADLTARIQEDARLDAVGRALSDENLALREEVKSLTQQLQLKSHTLGREEQLSAIQSFLQNLASAGVITICDTIKHVDLSGEDLFKLVREHIDDHEVATSKVSSALLIAKDKTQDLVTEALRFSYIAELEDQANKSMFQACRILLLEQLHHICPQVASQAREEARKVAVEWIAKLDNCADKFSEISRFLRFISSCDVASEFEDEVLVPILYNAAIHEMTADLCFTRGFENRVAGFTKTLLKSSQRLKALEYVSAFKLEKRYSVGKIVHEEMNHINLTCTKMLKEGGQGQAPEIINFEIDSLRELIKRIKDFKYEGKYTIEYIEQRLVKLENMKYLKKRSAHNPSPSSEHEPSRNKRCKLPGTSKLIESDPKDSVNVHPHIDSRDIRYSKPSSDSESLMMKGHNLTGTAKSVEVPPKDTVCVLRESGARDLCFSNPTSDPIPLSKEECHLATNSQSMESASTGILNDHPKRGIKALCCSESCIGPKPSRKEECQLVEISQPIEPASNDILNIHPEVESRTLRCSNSSSKPKPSMKQECQLPGTTQSKKPASNDTPNVNAERGSRSLCVPTLAGILKGRNHKGRKDLSFRELLNRQK